MILSNVEILRGLRERLFTIDNLAGDDPAQAPFNTSAVDLRLGEEIVIPEADSPVQLDLTKPGIAKFWQKHSSKRIISKDQPFSLTQGQFILARTIERVDFPLHENRDIIYSARVEGKSSLARCGILVHFTAPTIHAGFNGTITLEIINLGPCTFLLTPGMYICQIIIEEVKGRPVQAPNQFKGQNSPAGVV